MEVKCPICKNDYNSSKNIPRILINCGHTICSSCLNTKITENKSKQFTCPEDNILYENIESIEKFPINKSLIKLIESKPKVNKPKKNTNNSNNNNKTNNNTNTINRVETINSQKPKIDHNLFSTPANSNIRKTNSNFKHFESSSNYLKKSSMLRMSLTKTQSFNTNFCKEHARPLDVICIDEKIKICNQCALNPKHCNHQIVTDDEFMNQIDTLIDLFQIVDGNSQNYNEIENINTMDILEKINKKIETLKNNIGKKVEEIIININSQKNSIINYLTKRKDEINSKYKSSIDTKMLLKQTETWMNIVKDKLDILNEITDPNIECIKLIDNDKKKNQNFLINQGKQLNDRFQFIKQTESVIKDLVNFEESGIKIDPNEFIIAQIMNKKDNNNSPNTIVNNIFSINENTELIEKLQLKKFKFENAEPPAINMNNNSMIINNDVNQDENFIFSGNGKEENFEDILNIGEEQKKKTSNLKKSNSKTNDKNNIFDNFLNTKNEINYEQLFSSTSSNFLTNDINNENEIRKNSMEKKHVTIKEGNVKVPLRKSNTRHMHNDSFVAPKSSRNIQGHTLTHSKMTSSHKILPKKRSSQTPEKDKVQLIKNQIKNDVINFSRIDIGDDGAGLLINFLKDKNNAKFKEIKFVKCGLTDDGVIALVESFQSLGLKISTLNFSNNGLTDKCGNCVINLLKNNVNGSLKTLYLSNNNFSFPMKEKIKSYAKTVKGNGAVKIFI